MSAKPTIPFHDVVRTAAGFWDRSGSSRLEIGGPDRAKFLHNLTTQDVKHIQPGAGREAFVTSPQGKTLAFVTLLVEPERIWLRAELESIPVLMPHLAKYGLFDDVTIDDASSRAFEFHIVGPGAEEITRSLLGVIPKGSEYDHMAIPWDGCSILVARESPLGVPGLTLLGPTSASASIRQALGSGLVALDEATVEALRIEAGTPRSGRDVTPDNLPQEVGRDSRAISFVKGCYLGQETVARIDALGHVNRLLRGLEFEHVERNDPLPEPGAEISAEGKVVGRLTSVAIAPGRGVVGLGYVRVTHATAGTPVEVGTPDAGKRSAIVVELPFPAAGSRIRA